MKFYNRKRELTLIRSFMQKRNRAHIIVITGRRRIGKTRLVLEAVGDKGIYLFAKNKTFPELLNDWTEELAKKFKIYGKFENFEQFLDFLFSKAKNTPITVIFDEVQRLYSIFPESFSTIQKVYDTQKETSKILIIFTGSAYTLMEKIFKDSKEPLFGRASEIMQLSYLPVKALEEILRDFNLFSGENLLHLFSIFDGIPYYIEELVETGRKSFKSALKELIVSRDLLWEEGENLLKTEMGKEYTAYFSILSAIAKGRKTRNEIVHYTGIKEPGAYLNALEKTYRIIERKVVVTKGKKSKISRYYFRDNFLDFWFRFIERYSSYRELGLREKAFEKIWEELPEFEGKKLEKLVLRKIIEENPLDLEFTKAGSYWDRKGQMEVDLLLINEEKKIAYAFEIKRNKNKISKKRLLFLSRLNETIGELRGFKIIPGAAWIEPEGLQMKIFQ